MVWPGWDWGTFLEGKVQTPVPHQSRPKSCPPDLPIYSFVLVYPSTRVHALQEASHPFSAATALWTPFSGSHVPRSQPRDRSCDRPSLASQEPTPRGTAARCRLHPAPRPRAGPQHLSDLARGFGKRPGFPVLRAASPPPPPGDPGPGRRAVRPRAAGFSEPRGPPHALRPHLKLGGLPGSARPHRPGPQRRQPQRWLDRCVRARGPRARAPRPASVLATARMPRYIPCASRRPRPAPPPPRAPSGGRSGGCHVGPRRPAGLGDVRERHQPPLGRPRAWGAASRCPGSQPGPAGFIFQPFPTGPSFLCNSPLIPFSLK